MSVQSIIGAIANRKRLKSLISPSYQRLGDQDSLPVFSSFLAFCHDFYDNYDSCRSKRGQVVVGTINKRHRSDGTVAYSAQILLTRDGQIVHRESRTFNDRAMASGWITNRERELEKPDGIKAAKIGKETLADAIEKYITSSKKKIGRTKSQVLEKIKGMKIAEQRCADIGSKQLITLANELFEGGRQASTVGNYMSHLQAVFSVAKPAWGFELNPEAMAGAQKATRHLGLTSKSKDRERRPTLDELDKIMTHYETVEKRRNSTPMRKIIAFAIFSTRRQEEITRIEWKGLESGRVLVKDMKHPGDKIGNDTWCNLVPEAERVIHAMKKIAPEIFPYSTDAISSSFTRACKFLEIDDLHFHDLRHDGISRLFEMGWNIPHVATVSGHRSWQSLKRYTHLRHTGDKYQNWKWLNKVTT